MRKVLNSLNMLAVLRISEDPSRVDPPLRQPQSVRVESRLHALAGNSEDPPPPAVHLCVAMFSRRIVAAVDACPRLQGWRRIHSCRDLLGMLLERRTAPNTLCPGHESRRARKRTNCSHPNRARGTRAGRRCSRCRCRSHARQEYRGKLIQIIRSEGPWP